VCLRAGLIYGNYIIKAIGFYFMDKLTNLYKGDEMYAIHLCKNYLIGKTYSVRTNLNIIKKFLCRLHLNLIYVFKVIKYYFFII